MARLSDRLLHDDELARVPLARELVPILTAPAGTSSAGYPFLAPEAYARFRDAIPHILGMGPLALAAVEAVRAAADRLATDEEEASVENLARASAVVRTVLNTAAITAPSDLWLLRHVLGALKEAGLVDRLLAGERIDPAGTTIVVRGQERQADPRELDADLTLLLSRGYVSCEGGAYVLASSARARDVLARIEPVPAFAQPHASALWARAFADEDVSAEDADALARLAGTAPARTDLAQDTWVATLEEIELGYRLLPVVLGLRASEKHRALASGPARPEALSTRHPALAEAALLVLERAGVLARGDDGALAATPIGRRVLDKGAGPMGIIEAYHPYMARLLDILVEGRGKVWVARGTNIAASQDANRATFEKANDALDEMCRATGFRFRVFIEHAIGRGEATRQRFQRSGDQDLRYFGADLEDAAIDAAMEEQKAGRLPKGMEFIRHADIGDPATLVRELKSRGVDPKDAVMIVGNGFHEVRGEGGSAQTDERMIEVFRGYHDAGIVLLFTEESALSTDDLLATAWNTYHAGFRYVHEKSGQGLRPAEPGPAPVVGKPLRASWVECATRAGYVRADAFSSRSRTIYPTNAPRGHNPSVSVNHFFVPADLAARLGLSPSAKPPEAA